MMGRESPDSTGIDGVWCFLNLEEPLLEPCVRMNLLLRQPRPEVLLLNSPPYFIYIPCRILCALYL